MRRRDQLASQDDQRGSLSARSTPLVSAGSTRLLERPRRGRPPSREKIEKALQRARGGDKPRRSAPLLLRVPCQRLTMRDRDRQRLRSCNSEVSCRQTRTTARPQTRDLGLVTVGSRLCLRARDSVFGLATPSWMVADRQTAIRLLERAPLCSFRQRDPRATSKNRRVGDRGERGLCQLTTVGGKSRRPAGDERRRSLRMFASPSRGTPIAEVRL
jgi:hypothetical protein